MIMAEHMISTPIVMTTCRRCGRPILAAHSEGIPARADLDPLDRYGELIALLDGRATYDLQPFGLPRRPYLIHRYDWRIQAAPCWPIVADHKCPPGPHFPSPRKPPIDLVIPIGQSSSEPEYDRPPF